MRDLADEQVWDFVHTQLAGVVATDDAEKEVLDLFTEVVLLFENCVEVDQIVHELGGEDLLLKAGWQVVLGFEHNIDVGKLVQEFQELVQKEHSRAMCLTQALVQT